MSIQTHNHLRMLTNDITRQKKEKEIYYIGKLH